MIAAQEPHYQPTETDSDLSPSKVREFHEGERDVWDQFIASAPNGHVMQAWSWGEYKRRQGFIAVRLAVVKDNQIVAATQMFLRKAFGVAIAYVPRGPVCPPDDERSYGMLLEALHHHARRHRALLLRIEPNEPATSNVSDLLQRHGFSVSPVNSFPNQPRATLMVDLFGGPDAVLGRMKKRTRQHVRATERRLHVRSGADEEDVAAFHAVMVEIAERRGFDVKPLSYYGTLLEELGPRQQANLLLAELDGEVIAGHLVLAFGEEGLSMHGGARSTHQKVHANELLDWKAMQWCMQQGCTRYDLWGAFEQEAFHQRSDISQPFTEDDVEPEMRGIFRYKVSVGAKPACYMGPYDYPYHAPLYALWRKTARWQLEGAIRLRTLRNRAEVLLRRAQN